jgi:Type I phosphodiesterase / nucleotide pyrophosphatase
LGKKLVLVVVDAMHPAMLRRAVEEGAAPTFAELLERGNLIEDCVSSFPSVTPVASSELMTGLGADGHWVIGMNWFHRVERRYIEYGSSFEATRTFGLFRAMYDLIYNMNLDHLSWEAPTVFERLGDAGVRTATTPFLIYRGRRRHELSLEGLAKRAAAAASFRHAVWGPDEFFYGDLYASRTTGCGPTLSRPGTRDEYAACVGSELVREGAYELLLFSLPDNDFHSHRHGPGSTVDSIAKADRSFAGIVEAGGGLERFLDQHAVILTADHAQTDVEHGLALADELSAEWQVLEPNALDPEEAEIAVSPTSRAGAVYILDTGPRHADTHSRVRARLRELDGVDLIAWLSDSKGEPLARRGVGVPRGERLEAVVERRGRELRFRPGGQLKDVRGVEWVVTGDLDALLADITRGRFESEAYPDALGRLWSALVSPHAGDVMISAAEGYECIDWGGVSHVGGGSHGALSREDSLAPLLFVGCGPRKPGKRAQWALRDIAPVLLGHFGISMNGASA